MAQQEGAGKARAARACNLQIAVGLPPALARRRRRPASPRRRAALELLFILHSSAHTRGGRRLQRTPSAATK